MTFSRLRGALAVHAFLTLACPAIAHITLETKQVPIASTYKAVLRVGHGCNGASTVKLRVRIPEGVIAVEPVSKPGWTLDTVKGTYDRTYNDKGAPLTEGVREIV